MLRLTLVVLVMYAAPALADQHVRAPINPENEDIIDAHCFQRQGFERWSRQYNSCVEEQRWINEREAAKYRALNEKPENRKERQ